MRLMRWKLLMVAQTKLLSANEEVIVMTMTMTMRMLVSVKLIKYIMMMSVIIL